MKRVFNAFALLLTCFMSSLYAEETVTVENLTNIGIYVALVRTSASKKPSMEYLYGPSKEISDKIVYIPAKQKKVIKNYPTNKLYDRTLWVVPHDMKFYLDEAILEGKAGMVGREREIDGFVVGGTFKTVYITLKGGKFVFSRTKVGSYL